MDFKNKEKDLVSVVIPTYKRDRTLKRAIESVLNQTYEYLEIIVVDDNHKGSIEREKVEQIMENYSSDERILYIQNETNLGGSGARNAGIDIAKGMYIAFLDDDDEYYPEKIAKQVQKFKDSTLENLALVYCHAGVLIEEGKFLGYDRKIIKGNSIYKVVLENCIAATSQWLVTKESIDKIGGFPSVPSKQDSQTILKLLENGYTVDVVEEVLSKYWNDITERISWGGMKNIEGEKLYLKAARKNYDRLTIEQIFNIEFSFAERLFYLSYFNKQKDKWDYLKTMWKISSLKTMDYLIHFTWGTIKRTYKGIRHV
ncbi:MAG: glycosyltransferase family 2 protein [Lachnospiraceae bacterium]